MRKTQEQKAFTKVKNALNELPSDNEKVNVIIAALQHIGMPTTAAYLKMVLENADRGR